MKYIIIVFFYQLLTKCIAALHMYMKTLPAHLLYAFTFPIQNTKQHCVAYYR